MKIETNDKIIIYTDGGCDPNPGPGGWAVLLKLPKSKKVLSGHAAHTTNNRMELTAAIKALRAVKKPSSVVLITDSLYLQKGITQWLPNWIRKNWKRNSGEVANRDLWEQLLKASKNTRLIGVGHEDMQEILIMRW